MDKQKLLEIYNTFLKGYDPEAKDNIWARQSKEFRDFWNGRILQKGEDLTSAEIDQIVKILDRSGRGNTKGSHSIARVMIPQGAWRRMFIGIKASKEFSTLLDGIFVESDTSKKAQLINKLYKLNQTKTINNLTGPSGNAVCSMLAAFDPTSNLSVVALSDRERLCTFFGIGKKEIDFTSDDIGYMITVSNVVIIKYFRDLGVSSTARTISRFFYSPEFKQYWKGEELEEEEPLQKSFSSSTDEEGDPSLFYMESQLEDFLIENWDKTEFGKKYELIEENGELVSQQFRTDIGKIDILAKDKKTKQYVVFELKKNQTSDDTVGQLTRYMGWLEEHKTKGKATKGVIIAGQFDQRLYYASRKIKDVEIYLYEVDFKLKEFKK